MRSSSSHSSHSRGCIRVVFFSSLITRLRRFQSHTFIMDLKVLKNKGKLILKKREKLTEDVVSKYSDEEAQIQLCLLEDAFTKYNEAYEEKSAVANDEEIDKLIEDLETVSDYYIKVKSMLMGRLHARSAATSASENCKSQAIKLPPINIPIF